ncbi:MAG: 30S ribosomal protein S2 [Candidatus Omnitrophota bacterium]
MTKITIKQLLESGVHFGHQTQRWNPKMKKYIFGDRNGIHIINLEITVSCLETALQFLTRLASEGKDVLFVGTKKQAQESLKEAAIACEMPYVYQRWLGGMLTNFETIRKSIGRLDQLEQMEKDGSLQFLKKRESGMLAKERIKLLKNLEGIRKMRQLPGAIFVIDAGKEEIALHEAIKLGLPIVAIVDTNCNPDNIQYPIPGNDDAIRAIKLFCATASEAVREGRAQFRKVAEDAAQARTDAAAAAAAAVAVEPSLAEALQEDVPEEDLEEKLAPAIPEAEDLNAAKLKLKKPPRKDNLRSKTK